MQTDEQSTQTPQPFRRVSPGAIEIREGGGCMSVFGAWFFLGGLFLIASVTGVIRMANLPGGWGFAALVFMSVVSTGVGGVLAFGRRWLTLDVASGAVIRRQGLLAPMRHEQRALSEFNSVVIALTTDSDSADQYPIRLRAVKGKDLSVCSSNRYEKSLQQAEFLARFLQLPLTDTITDHETVTGPQQAGETLGQRLRSGGQRAESPPRPAAMRCEVRVEEETTVVIPGGKSRFAPTVIFMIEAIVLIVFLGGLGRFFARTGTPAAVQLVAMSFLVVVFGVAPLVATLNATVGAIRSRTTITARPTGLLIERRGAWGSKIEQIAAADIFDLDLSTFSGTLESTRRVHPEAAASPLMNSMGFRWLASKIPTKGLIVKSRRGLVTFGEGLTPEELEFLKRILLRGLTR